MPRVSIDGILNDDHPAINTPHARPPASFQMLNESPSLILKRTSWQLHEADEGIARGGAQP
jgi:hypothetical protein